MTKVLTCPSVDLEPLEPGDESLFLDLYCDPQTMKHLGVAMKLPDAKRAFRAALSQTRGGDTCGQFFWRVVTKPGAEAVGIMGLTRTSIRSGEVGILVRPESRGRNIAVEAIAGLADYMFLDRGDQSLSACHAASNSSTARLLTKLGFSRQPQGPAKETWHWLLLPEAWAAARQPWR